jgi:hypothetical protein
MIAIPEALQGQIARTGLQCRRNMTIVTLRGSGTLWTALLGAAFAVAWRAIATGIKLIVDVTVGRGGWAEGHLLRTTIAVGLAAVLINWDLHGGLLEANGKTGG